MTGQDKPVRVNWGLRLLMGIGRAVDWLDRLLDDAYLTSAHWRLLRKVRSASPTDRVLIACGYEIVAASNVRANALPHTGEQS